MDSSRGRMRHASADGDENLVKGFFNRMNSTGDYDVDSEGDATVEMEVEVDAADKKNGGEMAE